ncbi:MAG: DUF512 domain-containing protein [Bacillota bacterium]|jgi:putative radical SAM enzyme (TIGR03279 family)
MARRQGGLVRRVDEGSLAGYLGIEPGDRIVSVNGKKLKDELDFRFRTADCDVSIVIRKRDGREEAYEVEKDPEESFGVSFQDPVFDRVKTCKNNCVFCFIRQIPCEMRRALHVRDDDYRMSFLYGNFLSLTNLTEEDWIRLEEQKISPLRVSVHTTDPELRQRLMSNPEAARIMEHLERLVGMGIRLHAQLVILRGLNDGPSLQRTLRDLDSLGENMMSVGVVPAVYTRYRKAPPSPAPDPKWAGETLQLIEDYASGARKRRGDNWAYGADELYLLSGRPFPPYEYYGDFHQYENGIGIVPEFRRCLEIELGSGVGEPGCAPDPHGQAAAGSFRRAIAVTGEMAAGEVEKAVRSMGLEDCIEVFPVKNVFFGDTVTAAGLLTGQDVISAVLRRWRKHDLRSFDVVLIPEVALFEGAFLDNCTLRDVAEATGVETLAVKPLPSSLRQIVAGKGE